MKTIYKILIGAVVLSLVLTVVFVANTKKPKTDVSDLHIGAVLSLSGFGSSDSENIKRGMELAKEDMAKNGFNVVIDYQDDKTDPKETISAVRLLGLNHPDAIVGPIWSYMVDSAGLALKSSGVAVYSPSVTSEYVSTRADNIFHGAIKNIEAVPNLAKTLETLGVRQVAIVVTNDAWGNSMLEVFNTATAKAGAKVAIVEKNNFGDETTTIPIILTKIKSSGAQALLWSGSEEGALTLIKKMNEWKIDIPIIGTNALKNIIVKGTISKGNLKIYFIDGEKSSEFTAKFKAKYGVVNGTYAEEAYDGVMMLAEAKKNKAENESLADYLKNKTDYQGYAGKYKFDENGDREAGGWIITEI